MKKIVTIIICMFLSIVSVNAIVRNNYATSVNKTKSYITKFKDYKIFIDQEETLPYIYNKKGLSKSDTFKKSGLSHTGLNDWCPTTIIGYGFNY